LKDELRGQRWLIDEEDAAFSGRVDVTDVDDFIALVEKKS
jgi:hypothetical protein